MRNRFPELLPHSAALQPVEIVIEPSLEGAASQLIRGAGLGTRHMLVVCDTRTHTAMGARLMAELAAFKPELLLLPGAVHAEAQTLKQIRSHPAELLIAVGSGTISDLCKYASHLDKKTYVMFPTAPSMNGYLSANASIILGGTKKTLPAHLPKAVFCDLGMLAHAPARLIRSGLGDSLCRPTAQADWLASHLLLGTPYDPRPFQMLVPYEKELFAHADKLLSGDLKIMDLLIRTLLVSGLGMTLAGGSYPASEGEHMIAHTFEMKHAGQLPETYHGEQIGVTTLTMAALQEKKLSQKLHIAPPKNYEESIKTYFGPALSHDALAAYAKKFPTPAIYEKINARLASDGASIRDAIRQVTLPETVLQNVLMKAGAPTSAAELGWNETDYAQAVSHARFMRDRFTFLDL